MIVIKRDLPASPSKTCNEHGNARGVVAKILLVRQRHLVTPTRQPETVVLGVMIVLTVDDDVRIETNDEPREVVERLLAAVLVMPSGSTASQVDAVTAQALQRLEN
jgi:hypothetical protein